MVPNLVGVIPEVVIVTNLEGRVSEEPLSDAKFLVGRYHQRL